MEPGLCPQQRLYEVVTLPDLPKGLDPKIEMDQPLLRNPPKTSPRKLSYLFSVEWAWSPVWIALPAVLAEDTTQSNPDSAVAIPASKTPMNLALIF